MGCWQQETVTMLRFLIGDITNTPKYTDDRLESLLLVAAQLTQAEYDNHTNDYVINITDSTIDPNPVSPRDDEFISLMVLKAACILDQGELRQAAFLSGIKAQAGPVHIWTMGYSQSFQTLVEMGSCKAYDDLINHGTKADFIRSVLSPFLSDDFDPQATFGVDSDWYNVRSFR